MFFKECGNVTFFILVTESVVARDLDHGENVKFELIIILINIIQKSRKIKSSVNN